MAQSAAQSGQGPLAGLRVIEFDGLGPGPHCAMLLADLGADIIRIDRPGPARIQNPLADRGRATLVLDIRTEAARDRCAEMIAHADVVIEGFRPGVMERLGLGPEAMLAANPKLIYGRMTGWGQDGPLSRAAGHDINYIALTGALDAIRGRDGAPVPPLNLAGDFGGGSLFLAFGVVAALFERERSGAGQVIDAAIVDGVASMMTMFTGVMKSGRLSLSRGENMLGGDAPFYRCYRCADGLDIAVGAIEPQFYALLMKQVAAPADLATNQYDAATWQDKAAGLAALFATRTRAEWCALLEGGDACFAPVLTVEEAARHPHIAARGSYVEMGGVLQGGAAPRFSRTPGSVAETGRDIAAMLARWGVPTE